MNWKMKSGESLIYRGYTIECNYEKLNDCFKLGYDVIDNNNNPIIRHETEEEAYNNIDEILKFVQDVSSNFFKFNINK
jgi:hypothetical protein